MSKKILFTSLETLKKDSTNYKDIEIINNIKKIILEF